MKKDRRTVLTENLRRLRGQDPKFVRMIRESTTEGCTRVAGPRGVETIACDGIQLASAYSPEREGERIANEICETPADILVSIGFGLGHHLEAVRVKSERRIIVFEPSTERMRAALEIRHGFTLLGAKQIHFASTLDRLFKLIEAHYVPGLSIQTYIHPPTLRLAESDVRDAVEQISRAKNLVDISVATRVGWLHRWALATMNNAGYILQRPSLCELFGRFEGCPAVIVAAGPSLDKQLPILEKFKDRVLIIAIGQALGALRRVGIRPHFVHILESKQVGHQLLSGGSSEDVNLICTPDVSTTLFDFPVRSCFIATAGSDRIGRWIANSVKRPGWVMGGSTVSQGAVGIAAAMGAKQIMLIGQDLAYTNDQHYAKGSAYDFVKVSFTDDGKSVVDSGPRSEMMGSVKGVPKEIRTVMVDGWYGDQVRTSPAYAGFIDSYRPIEIALRQDGIKLINCTEGGAYIRGLEHIGFEEALEEDCGEEYSLASVIDETFDEWVAPSNAGMEKAIGDSYLFMARIEKAAEEGAVACVEAKRELKRARSPDHKINILRRIGKKQKKVQTLLVSVSWIDAVVQPEIYRSSAVIRMADNVLATPEQALLEAEYLFEATLCGIELANQLLHRCEDSIWQVSGSEWESKRGLGPMRGPLTAEVPIERIGSFGFIGAASPADAAPPPADAPLI